MIGASLAALTLAIWLYLVFAHGGFWRCAEIEPAASTPTPGEIWPAVIAVIPARNEAETLPRCLASLSAQTYPGPFSIIVVDDQSDDGTGDLARFAARNSPRPITVLTAPVRPAGWTGKVWAQHAGVTHAENVNTEAKYLLLTDADISYEPNALTGLVRLASRHETVLTSLMAKLNCTSFAERMLVPAFVYFFQMLFPFSFVNRASHKIAAAAGGCMLADRKALGSAGGMASIASALIDDCALARVLKRQGPIWLGLAQSVHSIRPYPKLDDIRQMVARSAYAQLNYSPLLLVGTTIGLIVVFLAAPCLTIMLSWPTKLLAIAAWALMVWSYLPILRYYSRLWVWAPFLPVMTALYLEFTLTSAYQHLRGRGGMWKGRVQAAQTGPTQS